MSMLELLVALAVLSLIMMASMPTLAPMLRASSDAQRDAAQARAAAGLRTTLSELAAGGIDLTRSLEVSPERAAFRAYVSRLSPTPRDVALTITHETSGDRLTLRFGDQSALLWQSAPPLRFVRAEQALRLETRRGQIWSPVLIAPFQTNAPLSCAFDLISLACRS